MRTDPSRLVVGVVLFAGADKSDTREGKRAKWADGTPTGHNTELVEFLKLEFNLKL